MLKVYKQPRRIPLDGFCHKGVSIMKPSTTGNNGRDGQGRFKHGNKAAKGNPHASKVAKLRSALLDAVTEDDIKRCVSALLAQAEKGNVQAIRELLDRCLGKAEALDLIERLERMEEVAAQLAEVSR